MSVGGNQRLAAMLTADFFCEMPKTNLRPRGALRAHSAAAECHAMREAALLPTTKPTAIQIASANGGAPDQSTRLIPLLSRRTKARRESCSATKKDLLLRSPTANTLRRNKNTFLCRLPRGWSDSAAPETWQTTASNQTLTPGSLSPNHPPPSFPPRGKRGRGASGSPLRRGRGPPAFSQRDFHRFPPPEAAQKKCAVTPMTAQKIPSVFRRAEAKTRLPRLSIPERNKTPLFCCVRKNQKNKVPNSTKSLFCCRSRNHWLLRSCLDIKKTHLPALSVHQRTTTCQAPKLQERQKSAVNNGAFCIFAQIICRPWHI